VFTRNGPEITDTLEADELASTGQSKFISTTEEPETSESEGGDNLPLKGKSKFIFATQY